MKKILIILLSVLSVFSTKAQIDYDEGLGGGNLSITTAFLSYLFLQIPDLGNR